MRVLLVILQFPPDVNSTGLLLSQLSQALRGHGAEIDVVTTFPHYAQFRVWEEYRGKLFERSHDNGLDVLRVYVHTTGRKQQMLNRFLSYLSFNVLATLSQVLSRRPYDVILCTNGGFFSGITAWIIGKAKGIPFVLNVQDLYPETPRRTGQIKSKPALAVLETLERFMYARASHLAVITPSFRDHLQRVGVPPEKISVIPNFVETDFIKPLPKVNALSQREGLAEKFVVCHAGNVGYVYDLDTMLDAAHLLKDRPEIEFLVVGEGVEKERLQRRARDEGLVNVRFLPYQPIEDLPWLRAACDVQVSLYRRGSAAHSMASKIYEIMASGRPLLASAEQDSDVWRLVQETGCGVCIEPQDADKLAAAVLRLYEHPDEREQMGSRGRADAERHYSLQAVAAQYATLLRNVAAHHRGQPAPALLSPTATAKD